MSHAPGLPVTVSIGGQDYEIRYSLKTLKALQVDHGIRLLKGATDALVDPEKLAVVLWYGLRDKNPNMSLDWVEEHVDAASLVQMVPDLGYAISGQEAEGKNGPRAVASGTGSLPGPSADTTSVLVNGRSGI